MDATTVVAEGSSWLDLVFPIVLLGVGAVVGFGFKWLKGFVTKTETKKDDELLAAIEAALKKALGGEATPTPPAA